MRQNICRHFKEIAVFIFDKQIEHWSIDFNYRISNMNFNDLKFKTPFTAMVAGPTGSGKTSLVRRILSENKNLILINDPLKVLWCYGCYQELYNKPINNVEISYVEGLTNETEIKEYKPNIIIIDDLMNELGNNKKLANLFTKNSHHFNMSVFFIVQNVFHQGSQMRNISLNCHYLILLKNPRDRSQILTLARQLYPSKPKYLLECYDDATSNQFGYILIDLSPTTPDKLRLRTRITLTENKYSPIIYSQK